MKMNGWMNLLSTESASYDLMCCVTRYKDKVFSINQLISCNLCYLCLLKLNVELVLECHSSIADDSSSLLRALVTSRMQF